MNAHLIQEGGIGAYAAIVLGMLGLGIGMPALLSLLGKSRSAFSLGIATLVVSAATAGAGMLGTVWGRIQVARAVASVDSSLDMERIMRAGFREAQSSSWVGLFAAVLPLVLGAVAAFGGSRLQQQRGPAQAFASPVVSSDDGLGGQSMVAIVFSIIALLASGGAWAMAHSELPKLRYAIDENDADSWALANAVEAMKDAKQVNPCNKLSDALEPFWGATDQAEWPRTMRRSIPAELMWRAAADDCAKRILDSLDGDDQRLTGRWSLEGLLRSPLLQDDALHARALAWVSKTPDEAPNAQGMVAALEGKGSALGLGSPPEGKDSGEEKRLSASDISKTVRGDLKALQLCYERELLKAPTLSGKLMVHFTVAASGKVVSAEEGSDEKFPSAKVTGCVLARFKALRFPPTPGGAPVKVNYPFVFQAAQ